MGKRWRVGVAAAVGVLSLAVAGLAGAAAGDFGQPSTSPETAGNTGAGIAGADFNGDSEADLAIANSGGNSVTILFGNGAGDFTAAPGSPETATGPSDIAAEDLDGDLDTDLAVGGTHVSILLNDGTGDFAPALTETLSSGARSIGIADMNGDTEPDVVVGQFFPATVTVLLNDGDEDGDFTALPTENAAENGNSNSDNVVGIELAQIDNDSDVDVMVSREFTGTARTLTNANGLGDLAFQGPEITNGGVGNADDVALGQFGSNAFNDLAIANKNNNNVSILIGQGDGSFTPAGTSPEALPGGGTGHGPRKIITEDLNGDSNMDLAMGAGYNGANSRVVVMLGNGAGNFTPTAGSPIDVGENIPNGIVADQFNGGNLDLAVTNFFPLPSSAVNILLNDFVTPPPGGGGNTTPATPVTAATPPASPKKCKKGQKLKKGKCVKKGKKKAKKK